MADGIAPFQILGTIELSIRFSYITTKIEDHIARNLCTNIILGMDYINRYNLSYDVKKQTISIEYRNNLLRMTIDSDYEFRKIPVTSSKSLYIPPYSTRSTKVTIPVASVCTSLIRNKNLRNSNSLFITHTLLNFRNHCSIISLCNTSSFP